MKNATTRALHDYWDRLRAGRAAPERGDLDPGAIRTLLGDVFLLEMDGQARRTIRLAGTRICSLSCENWPYWAGQTPLSRLRLVSFRHLTGERETAAVAPVPAIPRPALGRLRLLPGGRA